MSMSESAIPSASVVIPTYNRLQILRQVLDRLELQCSSFPATLEVVVVDDGSRDGTWEWLQKRRGDLNLIPLTQRNAGPARARNRGVAAATGEVVLFLGDDTVPQPGWLLEHIEEHRIIGNSSPVAVLGYTSFPPPYDTPFLRWINEFGAQFGYLLIVNPADVPFNFFYTSNISLPRQTLVDLGGFREDFPSAAWEDIEFAYRATRRGLELRYLPRARTVHHHRIRPGTFRRRQRTSGRSAAIFSSLHPELREFLKVAPAHLAKTGKPVTRLLRHLQVVLGELVPGGASAKVYERFLDTAYLQGLAEGLQSGDE